MGCFSDCAVGVIRIILFVFNFLIFICGVILITLGSLIQYNNVGYDVSAISVFAIVIGCFIGLVAFFGCCGACKGSSCLLTTYAAILITLFIIQVVLAIVIFVQIKESDDSNDLESELKKYLLELYQKYKDGNNDAKIIIDDLQQRYECCGVDSKDDARLTGNTFIPSCCPNPNSVDGCSVNEVYNDGCLDLLYDFIEDLAKVAGGIAIGFGVLELLGAIFAFLVRNHQNNKRQATY